MNIWPWVLRHRLDDLEVMNRAMRDERNLALLELRHAQTTITLLEQARDHFKADAKEWKTRASKFIDQIGIGSGTLSAPVMADPAAAPRDGVRSVMSSLGKQELSRRHAPPDSAPPSSSAGSLLGVDETAAYAAVEGVRT